MEQQAEYHIQPIGEQVAYSVERLITGFKDTQPIELLLLLNQAVYYADLAEEYRRECERAYSEK